MTPEQMTRLAALTAEFESNEGMLSAYEFHELTVLRGLEIARLRGELIAELRLELELASYYGFIATVRHCTERLKILEAARAAGKDNHGTI